MKAMLHGQTKKILLALVIVIIGLAGLFLLVGKTTPQQKDDSPSKAAPTTVNDDKSSGPNSQNQPNNDLPKPGDDTKKPTITPPADSTVCNASLIVGGKFTLSSPANVYVTALDAKNKANPTATYPSGEYYVYKCYDNMANITRTQGVPGGWINPSNPYQEPAAPGEAPNNNPAVDVMGIDNTVVNWSHEYPTAFVKEYDGLWNVSPSALYLTFDCGYDYNNLAFSIMDTLKAKGVRAVFFVTGDFMNDRPDLVKRMVNEGHVVGNHSYEHLNQPQNLVSSTDVVVADIRTWEDKYRSIVGANPSTLYFRPPAGAISRRSMALMDQLGYKTLMWGAAYKDWDTTAQPTNEAAMILLRQYTTAGDIVLLHGISQTSNDILSQYIDEYRNKGFTFLLP